MEHVSLIQYEFRYKPLLNFTPEVRGLAVKYFKLFNQINVSGEGTPDEQIDLVSAEDGYQIILSRTSTILRFDDSISSSLDKNFTPTKTFFKVLDDISKLSTYSESANHLLFHFHAVLSDAGTEEVLASFLKAYATPKAANLMDNPSDASFLVERRDETSFTQITAGPYVGLKDLTSRGVQPLGTADKLLLQSKKGTFYDIRTFEMIKEPDFEAYVKLVKSSQVYLKNARYE
jgi:hypothetical protein